MKNTEFETNLKALKLIVKELEEGNLSLDSALEKFETGVFLYKTCSKTLSDATNRVEMLLKELEEEEL